jgi:hypothetical protein
MDTAAPSAVMVEREHLVGRKCERAVTKTSASPPRAASSSQSISGVERSPASTAYSSSAVTLVDTGGTPCANRRASWVRDVTSSFRYTFFK